MEGMMPKRKTVKKVQPAIEIVDAPSPASKIEALVHESQDLVNKETEQELADLQQYVELLQLQKQRLSTALSDFNTAAPAAREQLRRIEGFRWHGGSTPSNLRELLEAQRSHVFGGNFGQPADVQIMRLLKRIDAFIEEVRAYQKETGQPLDYCARLIVSEIRSRVSGIVPIPGRDIPDIMRRIDETFQRFAEADLEARRQSARGPIISADPQKKTGDEIVIESNLNG
jgi:hypothetical protein